MTQGGCDHCLQVPEGLSWGFWRPQWGPVAGSHREAGVDSREGRAVKSMIGFLLKCLATISISGHKKNVQILKITITEH